MRERSGWPVCLDTLLCSSMQGFTDSSSSPASLGSCSDPAAPYSCSSKPAYITLLLLSAQRNQAHGASWVHGQASGPVVGHSMALRPRLNVDAGWCHTPPRVPRGGVKFTSRLVNKDRAALEDVTTDAAAGPGSPPR